MNLKKILVVLLILFLTCGCTKEIRNYEKYDIQFFDAFDTVTSMIIYEESEEKANEILSKMKDKFFEYHRIFDRYNNYKGINNLKTINDNAGIRPVKVSDELFFLIKKTIEYNKDVSDKICLTIGPVVDYWSKYNELYNSGATEDEVINEMGLPIPTHEKLDEFRNLINDEDIILNDVDKSVFLKKKGMILDLGAVAKGYATELVCNYAVDELGVKSGIVSAGGNVKIMGKPVDKPAFKVGIQNPNLESSQLYLSILTLNDTSVVTSGDYQRYFFYNKKRYCHIINAQSLEPADEYKSVTVISKDSFFCDYMSTTLFLSSYEEGLELCEKFDVDAVWKFKDGTIKATKGAKKVMGD